MHSLCDHRSVLVLSRFSAGGRLAETNLGIHGSSKVVVHRSSTYARQICVHSMTYLIQVISDHNLG